MNVRFRWRYEPLKDSPAGGCEGDRQNDNTCERRANGPERAYLFSETRGSEKRNSRRQIDPRTWRTTAVVACAQARQALLDWTWRGAW